MIILMPILCFLAAFLLLAGINRIELTAWTKSEGQHWAERSRILWPARRTNAILILYVPLLIAAGSKLLVDTSMFDLIPRWAAAMFGATGAGWWIAKKLYPQICLKTWLQHTITSGILRLGFWFAFIAALISMPSAFNHRTWLTLGGVIVLQIIWPFISLRLLRAIGILKPAGERLRNIVANCTAESPTKARSVWQATSMAANAMALPLSGSLIFYDALLKNLTDDEVASVCSHEIGHLAESKLILIGRIIGGMAILPLLLINPAVTQWGIAGLAAMVVAIAAWARLARVLVHRMEIRADKIACHQQSSAGVYARALEKLYQINHLPAVMHTKSVSHPNLYDRMIAAGVSPKFPPPRRPERFTILGWLMLFMGPMGLVWIFGDLFR